MLKYLLIVFCLSPLTNLGQDLINPFSSMNLSAHPQDSIINKRDSLGRKSGLWVKYFYDNKGNRRIVNTGSYFEGRKIGTWRYFQNDLCLSCFDTSKCISITEIYDVDGSLKILGIDETKINADSSMIVFTRKNHSEVIYKKNKQGKYECIRVFSSSKKPIRKTFSDFENCFINLDTRW